MKSLGVKFHCTYNEYIPLPNTHDGFLVLLHLRPNVRTVYTGQKGTIKIEAVQTSEK